jgi:hypothetical protein
VDFSPPPSDQATLMPSNHPIPGRAAHHQPGGQGGNAISVQVPVNHDQATAYDAGHLLFIPVYWSPNEAGIALTPGEEVLWPNRSEPRKPEASIITIEDATLVPDITASASVSDDASSSKSPETSPEEPSKVRRSGVTSPRGKVSTQFLNEVTIVPPGPPRPSWANDTPAPAKDGFFDRWITGAAVAIPLIVCGLTAWHFWSGSSQVKEVSTPPHPPGVQFATTPSQAAQNAAEACIERFQRTTTHAERLALIIAPEQIGDQMKQVHQDRPISQNLHIDTAQLLTVKLNKNDLARGIVALGVGGSPRRLFLFKDTSPKPGSWTEAKIDWSSWHQEMTQSLQAFAANPQSPPGLFRVHLQRKHYFGPQSPTHTQEPIALNVQTLAGAAVEANLVIPFDDDLYHRMKKQLPWTEQPLATVMLTWDPAGRVTGKPEIRISKFLCWEALHLGGTSEDPTWAQAQATSHHRTGH